MKPTKTSVKAAVIGEVKNDCNPGQHACNDSGCKISHASFISVQVPKFRQHRIVNTGQCACAITWCAVDQGRCVVPTSAEVRAPSTIMSATRSAAAVRMH